MWKKKGWGVCQNIRHHLLIHYFYLLSQQIEQNSKTLTSEKPVDPNYSQQYRPCRDYMDSLQGSVKETFEIHFLFHNQTLKISVLCIITESRTAKFSQ